MIVSTTLSRMRGVGGWGVGGGGGGGERYSIMFSKQSRFFY